jgi:hypothetical protein
MQTGFARKLAFTCVVVIAFFGCAEALVRLALGGRLPSLGDVQRSLAEPAETLPGAPGLDEIVCLEDEAGPIDPVELPDSGPIRLVVTGDSVAQGVGASREELGVAPRLGVRVGERLGRPVEARIAGVMGAEYCEVARWTRQALEDPEIHAVVHFVFADDLHRYARMWLRGQVLFLPNRIVDPTLRAAATHSFLVNLAWFEISKRRPPAEESKTLQPSTETQQDFQRTQRILQDQARAVGKPLLIVLVPATDHPLGCGEDSRMTHPMTRTMCLDLDLMAALLADAEVDALDLREIWDEGELRAPADEAAALEAGGYAVHPDDVGHDMLAEAIAPALIARMRQHGLR